MRPDVTAEGYGDYLEERFDSAQGGDPCLDGTCSACRAFDRNVSASIPKRESVSTSLSQVARSLHVDHAKPRPSGITVREWDNRVTAAWLRLRARPVAALGAECVEVLPLP